MQYGAHSNLLLQQQISRAHLEPGQFYKISPSLATTIDPKLAKDGAQTFIWVDQ